MLLDATKVNNLPDRGEIVLSWKHLPKEFIQIISAYKYKIYLGLKTMPIPKYPFTASDIAQMVLNNEKARINVTEAFTDLVSQINNKLPQQKQFQTSSPNGGSSGCLGGCSCNIL